MSKFEQLPNQGDAWGLIIDIPGDPDLSKTSLSYVRVSEDIYYPVSTFLDGKKRLPSVDTTWLCDSVIEDDLVYGYCYNFLPIKNVSGYPASYRFST